MTTLNDVLDDVRRITAADHFVALLAV